MPFPPSSDPTVLKQHLRFLAVQAASLLCAEAETRAFAVKTLPELSPSQATSRTQILRLAAGIVEQGLAPVMEELVEMWAKYKETR